MKGECKMFNSMVSTDELYIMVEPLLQDGAQPINNEGGRSKMVDLYAAMVMRGLKTIEQVPARYREEVRAIISELEK